ncbi:NUDIX domain-containing protein [Herbidospora cretacea]|uniref:NUDIX domain-containing protein n=1 Tax=Herbidospora cretacea TaxID=28444 RepID=UPI00068F49D3|nr:NUDIX domain-containing protein [Herbidospora cretacea]
MAGEADRDWLAGGQAAQGDVRGDVGPHVHRGGDGLAAGRELLEETGLDLIRVVAGKLFEPEYMHDPRAGRAAWIVSWLVLFDLGEVDELPVVEAGDDAAEVAWVRADTFEQLLDELAAVGGESFPAHVDTLRDALDGVRV